MHNGMPTIGTFRVTLVSLSVLVSGNIPPIQIVLYHMHAKLPTKILQAALMGRSMVYRVLRAMPPREMPICGPFPAATVHPSGTDKSSHAIASHHTNSHKSDRLCRICQSGSGAGSISKIGLQW